MDDSVRRRFRLLLMVCALALRSLAFAAVMPMDSMMTDKVATTVSNAATEHDACSSHEGKPTDAASDHGTPACQIVCDLAVAPALATHAQLALRQAPGIHVAVARALPMGTSPPPENPPPIAA